MTLLLLLACAPEEVALPTSSIKMLEEVTLDAPTDPDDPTPERAATSSGEGDGYDWALLRGWVKTDNDAVFEALTNPDVGVDRREIAEWSATDIELSSEDVDNGVDTAYAVVNTVTDPITVEFEVGWRHDRLGDEAESVGSLSAWTMTVNNAFMTTLEGSAQATVDGDAVDLAVVYHLATIDSGPEDVLSYLEDFYASVLATAHGEALPTWE